MTSSLKITVELTQEYAMFSCRKVQIEAAICPDELEKHPEMLDKAIRDLMAKVHQQLEVSHR